jgi:hypothetical protein
VAPGFILENTYMSSVFCGSSEGIITNQADCEATVTKYIGASNWGGVASDLTYHPGCIIHDGKGFFVSGAGGDQEANDGYFCQNKKTHLQTNYCGMSSTASAESWVTDETACVAAAAAAGYSTYIGNKVSTVLGTLNSETWQAGCFIHGGTVFWAPYITGSNNGSGNTGDSGYLCKNPVATAAVCAESDCTCTAACESDCNCNKIVSTTTPGWSATGTSVQCATTGTSMTITNANACPAPSSCAMSCAMVGGNVVVTHTVGSAYTHHKCYILEDGTSCTCLCGNGSVPDRA